MGRHIVFLRGVNLGPRNRIAMPKLREALSDGGFDEVRTYLQSGNVVLASDESPEQVARKCKKLIADRFGLEIEIVRTRDELAAVVKRNPLRKVAKEPTRYQSSFLAAEPDPEVVRKLSAAAVAREKLPHVGHEIYAWQPDDVGRSKLAAETSARSS